MAILSQTDQAYLAGAAQQILDSARLAPGQTKGEWTNLTPYTLHVPGGNMGYPAFWVRDAVMMLDSGFIPVPEIEGWIRLISSTVRDDDWDVRSGVAVPAFAIPDHITFDGKPSFYPGSYETGSKQGGYPYGKYPPLDDQFYYISAVYHYWNVSKSIELFRSKIDAGFGRIALSDLCERVYHAAPSDPETKLCIAGDIETENAKDFGFCDCVFKSGKLLFTSVLKYVAANHLGRLFAAAGDAQKASAYQSEAREIKAAIPATFLHLTARKYEAWLHSATGLCNQPDIWGSAFAVYSGAVDIDTAAKIGHALVRAYYEQTAVREGCVRHILANDLQNPNGWQKTLCALGDYQNGGYWGAPVGWYLAAMHHVDAPAAARMAGEYIAFLKHDRRPDGLPQAYEWFNPDTGRLANPLYAATVALPYGALREAGLLSF